MALLLKSAFKHQNEKSQEIRPVFLLHCYGSENTGSLLIYNTGAVDSTNSLLTGFAAGLK